MRKFLFTRRYILGLLPGLAAAAASQPLRAAREYSAKATILMFSVPIFHRDNVGGGFLRIEERAAGEQRHIRYEFGAGSLPGRAAGLNRLGVIEENVVESKGSLDRVSYFGFMTASGEKNLDQAKAALESGHSPSISAILGRIEKGRVRHRLLRLSDLPPHGWDRHGALADAVRERLSGRSAAETETAVPVAETATFLHAVSTAMRAASGEASSSFVHNGEFLQLHTRKRASRREGELFVRRGLVTDPDTVIELDGRIASAGGKELTAFRLWFDSGAPLPAPLRFEFRPRSFLRLSFEAVAV